VSPLPLLAKDYQLVLEPGRAERHYWRDVWAYRELFAILAWRDVAVRYKQTVIGVLWAVVRPLLTMVGTRRSARKALMPSPKAAAHWAVVNYRNAYELHVSNGNLLNHESPLRPRRFVTKKIIAAACAIKAMDGGAAHSRQHGCVPRLGFCT
jgi:hypothetical protein